MNNQIIALSRGVLFPLNWKGEIHSIFTQAVNIKIEGKLISLLSDRLIETPSSILLVDSDLRKLIACLQIKDKVICQDGIVQFRTLNNIFVNIFSSPIIEQPFLKRNIDIDLLKYCLVQIQYGFIQHIIQYQYQSLSDYWKYILENDDLKFDIKVLIKCIGKGIGLTPAGDDFIIGVSAVYYFLSDISLLAKNNFNLLQHNIIQYLSATNEISANYLLQASQGYFNQPLSCLVNALLEGNNVVANKALMQVLHIGASSGTDCVAGVLYAFHNFIYYGECNDY